MISACICKTKPLLTETRCAEKNTDISRAACEFHERHNPPRLDDDGGENYWNTVTEDMGEIAERFNQDPFIIEMLIAVFGELERQFKLLRDGGGRHD